MSAAKDPTLPSFGDSIPGWLNDLGRLYFFSKADGDQIKAKVNGLSIGLDHLKVALGVTAVGLTAIKLDFTALKIDEKGIVLFGRQKVTWPHARDDKAKGEAAEKLLKKQLNNVDTRISRVEHLSTATRNSGGNAYLQEMTGKEFKKLQKMQQKINAAQQELKRIHDADASKKNATQKLREDESGEIAKVSRAVERLSAALG
ncbi:hypothetical protein ACIOUE_33360 [Streptomyces xanthochromogenes]|uniref:hypothetical protein n=1 Tax=Streptomyces xanthochromogenes TaxID=67384 RepID=UPI00380A9FF8